jgi:hypothetical protein
MGWFLSLMGGGRGIRSPTRVNLAAGQRKPGDRCRCGATIAAEPAVEHPVHRFTEDPPQIAFKLAEDPPQIKREASSRYEKRGTRQL